MKIYEQTLIKCQNDKIMKIYVQTLTIKVSKWQNHENYHKLPLPPPLPQPCWLLFYFRLGFNKIFVVRQNSMHDFVYKQLAYKQQYWDFVEK